MSVYKLKLDKIIGRRKSDKLIWEYSKFEFRKWFEWIFEIHEY